MLQSFKSLLSSWVNLLLIAVPLSFISHFAGWGAAADFIISFIAIIPLAGVSRMSCFGVVDRDRRGSFLADLIVVRCGVVLH